MPERPPPSDPSRRAGPAEGTPEYDWLYGTAKSRGSGADDQPTEVIRQPTDADRPEQPDATRVLPTVPRSQEYADPAGPRPANREPHRAPPPPPTAPGPDRPAGRPRRRRRFRVRWLLLLLLAWLLFLLGTPIYAWTTVSQVDAFPDGERPGDQPGTTYLLVGSDSRGELEEEGNRTDTILLLHTGSGPNLLLSIPRDSIVDIPGRGENKINAAFAFGGAPLLVETIEQNTGIRVDDFVAIGFTGVTEIVDAVGGIEICPEEAIDDPQADLDVEAGCQEADGETALAYSRSRKASQLGDIDRARRQREVVSKTGDAALSPWTVLNPVRYWRVSMAGAGAVVVSEGTGPVALGQFALAMTRVDGEDGLTCGVPIADLAVNWDPERSQALFDRIIEDDTAGIGRQLCTPTGLPRGVG